MAALGGRQVAEGREMARADAKGAAVWPGTSQQANPPVGAWLVHLSWGRKANCVVFIF